MPDVVIENPVINSPFEEPRRHFVFADDGITDQIADTRRVSSYFIPIPPPKKKGGQQVLPGDWLGERIKSNEFINRVRASVSRWRQGGYEGVTPTTRALLQYWRRDDRERRLFFCQVEALETAIYVSEVASRYGDQWIDNSLRAWNEAANPGLDRIAFKMATGSGKTVMIAMLIAWQALNKFANPQDRRFTDAFLIVTPGITIRDRLRVVYPNDTDNYYVERDLVFADQLIQLQQATIEITNYHAFLRREKLEAATLTKKVLAGPDGNLDAFKETSDEMVRRVCRSFGNKKGIVVINDEAHHCYREKPEPEAEKMGADEKQEAKANAEAARVWISGLEAVRAKMGLRAVYDLSATPFFLRGSGYAEGTLFPWVVSDFSLIDAIESGVVKVPRVPVADDQMLGPCRRTATFGHGSAPACRARADRLTPTAASLSCRRSWRARYIACTGITRSLTRVGRQRAWVLRRCSSSSATTPMFPSSSTTGSPVGTKRSAGRPCRFPATSPCSAMSMLTGGWTGPTRC